MEKTNKPLEFTNISNVEVRNTVKDKPKVARKSKIKLLSLAELENAFTVISLERDTRVALVPSKEEDYSTIKTIHDIIELDKRNSNLIAQFYPPLSSKFIDIVNASINTHIKVGDTVNVKKFYRTSDVIDEKPRVVTKLYLKALNNMTVIIAVLEDNDFYLTYYLQKTK